LKTASKSMANVRRPKTPRAIRTMRPCIKLR
jgi:hypothetical protein